MTRVSVEEAESQIAALIEKAARGEEIVLVRNGQAVARLSPAGASGRRRAGMGRGVIRHIADDFDAPLADFDPYGR